MLFQVVRSLFSGGSIDVLSVLMQIAAVLIIIFLILPLHELAHGWVAYKLGDNTAKYNGRLTFNPIASIDPLGALCILLFGFGWAKPVPVNSRNFKNPKRDMAITALAGPLSNLLAALVGALLQNVLYLFVSSMPGWLFSMLNLFLGYYVMLNVMLAVFNLIPLPPLDGSRIVGAFMSDRMLFKYYQYQRVIMLVLFLLLFTGILSLPLGYLQSWVSNAIYWLAGLPFIPFAG